MAGEGGELEEIGGSSEKKARIVGSFTGALLVAVAIILLGVILFLFLKREAILPGASEQPKQSLVGDSMSSCRSC